MNTEILNRHLFSAVTRAYAILDCAGAPDLTMKLYEMRPPHYCLFTGELEPDMIAVAPYLVRLQPRTPFAEWALRECWGKNCAIFMHSLKTLEDMRTHFRSLVTVYDEKGDPLMFRYYDPRVLRRYLPTCNAGELKIFFGETDAFFAESEDGNNLTQFKIGEGGLDETALPVQ